MHKAREHILARLSASREPVSGDMLAAELGISRSGVWKHIRILRQQGADIIACAGRGYRLQNEPFHAASIRAHCRGDIIGRDIRVLEETDSTNRQAMLAAEQGAEEGLAIFARRQTAGRGRLGRTWHTLPDSLACSVLLRPAMPPERVPQLSLLTAVALHEAISELVPELRIKWPNDLLYRGAKLGGILTEMRAEPGQVHAVVLGFGINLTPPTDGWPAEIGQPACALGEIAPAFSRLQLAARLLNSLDCWYARFMREGFAPVHRAWWQAHAASGEKVRVHDGRCYIEGVAAALDEDGALLLQTPSGSRRVIAGDIEMLGGQ